MGLLISGDQQIVSFNFIHPKVTFTDFAQNIGILDLLLILSSVLIY